MVLVNDGGGPRSYHQLEHADWNGWTLTDTVFPSFLWMVGLAITLSLGKRLQTGVSRRALLPAIVRRSATLFLIGFLLYLPLASDLAHARILGVLQRIAICYLLASCLYLFTGVRGQIAAIIGLLTLYTALMTWYPVPGYGPGRLDVEGNFAHYIDRLVLGSHNYWKTKTWDPEGVVSTIPAFATTLLGVMAGHLLRLSSAFEKRLAYMLAAAFALICAGLLWAPWMPINKKLWSGSFTLFMAGLDFAALAVLLWFIDGLDYKRAVKPLIIVGMNSIAIYVVSELFAGLLDSIPVQFGDHSVSLHALIYERYFATFASVENASLAWAVCFTVLMYLLAYFLYKKSWFWKI